MNLFKQVSYLLLFSLGACTFNSEQNFADFECNNINYKVISSRTENSNGNYPSITKDNVQVSNASNFKLKSSLDALHMYQFPPIFLCDTEGVRIAIEAFDKADNHSIAVIFYLFNDGEAQYIISDDRKEENVILNIR